MLKSTADTHAAKWLTVIMHPSEEIAYLGGYTQVEFTGASYTEEFEVQSLVAKYDLVNNNYFWIKSIQDITAELSI